jgi:DNA-binding transcriptional LysR family regulator
MNLRQLRYISEIAKRRLNITSTAEALNTNQSGVSKQLKLLEEELGLEIFVRSRNRLSGSTPHGRRIIALAENILNDLARIKSIAEEVSRDSKSSLAIGITHTQARYVLPEIIKRFSERHPKVRIRLRHAEPGQLLEMLLAGAVDMAVTASDPPPNRDLVILPFRQFHRVIIVPKGHKLLRVSRPTLRDIAEYPIVTYEPGYSARQDLVRVFKKAGLEPKIAISAIDADVIKSCVEQGLGITMMSEVTFDPKRDTNLRSIVVEHLFEPFSTKIVLAKQHGIRQHTYDFIEMCAPQWARERVELALQV